MTLFLSKFLPQLIYPLGFACLLIIIALLVIRHPRWHRILLLLALLVLWIPSNNWVALGLARSLEWRYLPPQPIPQADVIVVLGGGTLTAEYPRSIVEVNGAGDRVIYAAWLYKQGISDRILLTGGTLGWNKMEDTPAEQMAALLEMMGIPEDDLWLEPHSRNTYENAVNSAKLLEEKGISSVLLVTSAIHMPRAVRLFEAQGLDVIPLPTDYRVTEADWKALWDTSWESFVIGWLPSASSLALTTDVLKEYLGMAYYSFRGWQ